MENNIILDVDSYKLSHFLQYPPNTKFVSSYIEARKKDAKTLFFGTQMVLQKYLAKPFSLADILEADSVATMHGLPFNKDGWLKMYEKYKGFFPIRIEAVEEGSVIPSGNVLLQVVNTDPEFFWITSYVETLLLRAIWYPTTVATKSYEIKQLLLNAHSITSDSPVESVLFKLHDFGARGVSSRESAEIGGCAHLVNFRGSDTLSGILAARKYYDSEMAGFSIPAAEHSTITSWGKNAEKEAYDNMLTNFAKPGSLVAVVSDSYDIYNAVENIWGRQLKQKVIDSGATVVIRPDSGDPTVVPIQVITMLTKSFGYTVNSKGYKVLPSSVRVIQGDGINGNSITKIVNNMIAAGLSIDNLAFGMGGGLLQELSRDTLDFAMKCSAANINDRWVDVYKNPVTSKAKESKKGKLALIKEDGVYKTISINDLNNRENLLKVVFENGEIVNTTNFEKIRQLSEM